MTYDGETQKASIHLLAAYESMSVAYYYIPQDSPYQPLILKAKHAVKEAVEQMLSASYMREEQA